MLVLSRKPGEEVVIDGGIRITVVSVSGSRVRLGIKAPDGVCILRGELAEWQQEFCKPAKLEAQKNGDWIARETSDGESPAVYFARERR